ncbi:MAG: 4Fe-4S binding protein, partial [Candidatus Cloacimonetes bacterium]|nr:4Fe-4S binding protein [Candidatus Cloacimonadota bacterium]
NIDDYIANDGYKSIEKVLKGMTQVEVINEIKKSGLRGRGGAGFSTGLKWQFAYDAKNDKKYVICNADEGDPGAFMDRSVLEGDPHSILEGMAICAYAIGADEGYIYCRAEYPLAVKHLNIAIKDAETRNLLGKNILGTDFSLELHVKEGAGAFVCGEETALIASIEGERGMPRLRPPFPAQSGLWKKPTNNNNVETYANIPWIILHGAEEYAKFGTEESKGTKVFALAGKIKNSGLIEVPMGLTIKDVVYKVGGGMKDDKPFKAVQLGGPSGGCIPAELIDTVITYESIVKTGAIMGSGGMVVMDTSTCMVDIARFFLNFTQNESCGKCTFCRIGTKRMLEILNRITEGKGVMEDIDKLLELSTKIINTSLCGLGKSAPNPVLTTLRYFRHEYEAHIKEKRCPAGVCTALLKYEVITDKCVGCTACARKCPTNAISGEVKKPHFVNQELCIKCGACYDACRFQAISKV